MRTMMNLKSLSKEPLRDMVVEGFVLPRKEFLIVIIFLLLILKVSSRENIEELNKSLENIGSIDVLGSSNGGQ